MAVPRSLVYLVLFVGLALVMQGISDEKVARARRERRVEYRFIPRTLYEEQLGDADNVASKFKGMF